MSLDEITRPTRTSDGYRLDVPPGWRQGRGAYGGFTIASLIHAIEDRVGDPARTVRTVTAELPSPVETGAADLTVDVLRVGNSVTTARAALTQGGETKAHVVAVLAAPRTAIDLAWQDLAPPQAPPWTELAPMPTAGAFPEFALHFEYRIVEGVPMSGAASHTIGWLRPRVPVAMRDAAYLAALADVWFPAALVRMRQIRPMATIAYTLEIVSSADGLDPEAPLLYRATVPVLADGYFVETRELWGVDGRLLARNHQTFVVIA
jgi:acyl-CoA thioesterase